MIFVVILTYNRPDAVQKSLELLQLSLKNAKADYNIHIFDDGSDIDNFNKTVSLCKILFDSELVFYHRVENNIGYNKNSTFELNAKSCVYVHESDVLLSEKWIRFMLDHLYNKSNSVITPVHLVDHLLPWRQRILINQALKDQGKHLKLRRKTKISEQDSHALRSCYGTVGTFAFGKGFHSILSDNVQNFPYFQGSEDAFVSFLASNNLFYAFPGLAQIHSSPGLHGNMQGNIASYEKPSCVQISRAVVYKVISRYMRKLQKLR
jgi:glycosyltransferase involved in cell wall biosynthesis